MTTLSNQVIPCSPDEWKFVETPIGNCPDAQAARHAEEQLRAVFPQENNCGAAIRVRGGCAVKTDLGGLHTINGSDGTAEFQIVLLDGSEVKAAAPMTWKNGIAELDMGTFYIAHRLTDQPHLGWMRYRVEERMAGRLTKTFFCHVPRTQAASATPSDVAKVERWCKSAVKPLPPEGETIVADLDYIQKE